MFKRELIISLPGFMVCMLPALEEQNSDLLKKIEEVLGETEKIVGTSKFFGEIWKTMIRTPRCRLSAIKYLDRKIPKDMDAAARMIKENRGVHLSQYNLVVRDGKALLEDYNVNGKHPSWLQEEISMKSFLEKADKSNI